MAPARDAYDLRAGLLELRNAIDPGCFLAEAARMVPAPASVEVLSRAGGDPSQVLGR